MFVDPDCSQAAPELFEAYAELQQLYSDIVEGSIGSDIVQDVCSHLNVELPSDWSLPDDLPPMLALMTYVPLSGGRLDRFIEVEDGEFDNYNDIMVNLLAAMFCTGK